jgi:hypothetical protein
MTGLELLGKLPENVKAKISGKYGSLEKFYQRVFELSSQDYKALGKNSLITNEVYNIEDELEVFGVVDGSSITQEIRNDFADTVVAKHFLKF